MSSDIFYETSSTSGSASSTSVSSPVLECLKCNGSEPRLINCNVASQCSCQTTGYAGVICQGQCSEPLHGYSIRTCWNVTCTAHNYVIDSSTPMADCVDGELRLVNGSDEREGRLEICFNRAWGTICADEFNQTEATVACGQLGFSREGAVLSPPRPLPDFILQPWRKIGRRLGIKTIRHGPEMVDSVSTNRVHVTY